MITQLSAWWKSKALWVVVSVITTLVLINSYIYSQEQLLVHGQIVRFELAPVDPRSLMQGDYMALRYQLAPELAGKVDTPNADGLFVVSLDSHRLAKFVALFTGQPLAAGQMLIQYRIRNDQVKLASNAYFFEEGQAEKFSKAKYGEFRVSAQGQLLLAKMLDKNFDSL